MRPWEESRRTLSIRFVFSRDIGLPHNPANDVPVGIPIKRSSFFKIEFSGGAVAFQEKIPEGAPTRIQQPKPAVGISANDLKIVGRFFAGNKFKFLRRFKREPFG